ncbi:hypothetical protein [Streptosporangium sp. NPDC006007]|uniref:hypothetical protein n=1 Tax=Streptosporangium sp. NPDC006007 TaxID=3154575 RepID=UPI0033A78814
MIVEDENGRDIDLRDLDDDREPEPPEPEEEQPLDLDELAATLADAQHDPYVPAATAEVLNAVPRLLARLRAAEAELADWRGRSHRYEYAVTYREEEPSSVVRVTRAHAERAWSDGIGYTPWVRTISTSDWAELTEAPF